MTEQQATTTRPSLEPVPLAAGALGWAAMGAAAYWVVVAVAFHWIRDDLAPCCAYVSNYARGDSEWLMQSAFVVLGFGWMAIGIAFARTLKGVRGQHWLTAFAVTAGVGLLVAGLWRTDDLDAAESSTEGMVHTVGSLIAFAGPIAFGLTAAVVLRRTVRWRSLATPNLWLAVATLALLITYTTWATTIGDGFGWWQRLLVVLVMPGWLAWLGWQLARVPQSRTGVWGPPTH
ncbi:DUF998 domain-containing protein [Demequina sp. NBRC 110056]|uniref:DUF998 domain-containing protein n=1 Tax=Demequina sp. NBRC 110056 TaxID=1570345 RepID=UPI000A0520BF|nr:DUF998 domain-containing protein [Demequina sp. NBRC 110056]